MKSIAIITARGGSKRIPRKNCKLFLGVPIISYSIKAALESGVFDEVMVSTDDEEIAEIAKQAGAKVPFFRSAKTSDDFATTADVIAEVLETYEANGVTFTHACCIYPTAPFVTSDVLKEAMFELVTKKADAVMPVVAFSFPPQRCVVIKEEFLEPKWPENMMKRSQDLEKMYHDCGQFYAIEIEEFKKQKKIVMQKTFPLVLPETQVQDIDTEEDWLMAELKYQLMKKKK